MICVHGLLHGQNSGRRYNRFDEKGVNKWFHGGIILSDAVMAIIIFVMWVKSLSPKNF